jgi:hypothetical protein
MNDMLQGCSLQCCLPDGKGVKMHHTSPTQLTTMMILTAACSIMWLQDKTGGKSRWRWLHIQWGAFMLRKVTISSLAQF